MAPDTLPRGWVDSTFARGYLEVSSKKLRRICASGQLQHERIDGRGGGEYRFRIAWLDAYVARRRQQPPQER